MRWGKKKQNKAWGVRKTYGDLGRENSRCKSPEAEEHGACWRESMEARGTEKRGQGGGVRDRCAVLSWGRPRVEAGRHVEAVAIT